MSGADELDDNAILTEICNHPILPREEQIELARRWKAGDHEARKALERANLRLVVRIARKSYIHSSAITLLDLVNEGYAGLRHASKLFDPDKGFAYTTYATYWIRQAIQRAVIANGKTLRIPVHRQKVLNEITRIKQSYEQQFGRPPSFAEIVSLTGVTAETLTCLIQAQLQPVSLAASNSSQDDRTALDRIADETTEDAADRAVENDFKRRVNCMLERCHLEGSLSLRALHMVRMKFGLPPHAREHTLDEIGQRYHLTRERVRQIITNDAFPVLRRQPEMEDLHAYIVD